MRDKASLEALFEGAKGATVYHAAGIVHPTEGIKQFYAVNAEGTTVAVLEEVWIGILRAGA